MRGYGLRRKIKHKHALRSFSMNKQITIEQFDLESAAAKGLINTGQIGPLWQHLEAAASGARVGSQTETAHFSFGHLLYYFGGLIAIGALSLFTTLGFFWRLRKRY
jgi:hypothetical protein